MSELRAHVLRCPFCLIAGALTLVVLTSMVILTVVLLFWELSA